MTKSPAMVGSVASSVDHEICRASKPDVCRTSSDNSSSLPRLSLVKASVFVKVDTAILALRHYMRWICAVDSSAILELAIIILESVDIIQSHI